MVSMKDDRLVTLNDVVEWLGVGRSTVYAWVKGEGVDPPFPQPLKLGSCTKFIRREVEEWVSKRRGDVESQTKDS